MGKLSEQEREVIMSLGLETFKLLSAWYKMHKAKGIDLDALMDKAEDLNTLDVDAIE